MISNAVRPLFDIHANSLLTATFSNPSEVLSSPNLTCIEKRCVLAAWTSDAFAVEVNPWLGLAESGPRCGKPGSPARARRRRPAALCRRVTVPGLGKAGQAVGF
jgi:hypothetical protein